MRSDLVESLACPACKHAPLALAAEARNGNSVESGELRCSCGARYPIARGIPCFVPEPEVIQTQDQKKELEARNYEYKEQIRTDVDEWRAIEFDAFRSYAGDCSRLRVLDAGCGLGQMTGIARNARRVVALDFAREGLYRFRQDGFQNLDLVNGDCLSLPFSAGSFDLAISSQVIEHFPARELRVQFLKDLARVLAPGGRAIVTGYNWCQSYRQEGLPKEGYHKSGIFYHRYDPEELREDMASALEVERLIGIRNMMPGTFRLMKLLGRRLVYWERFWRNTGASLRHGAYLMAIGRVRA